jgi:ATP-dependent protease ClpP protease subunit
MTGHIFIEGEIGTEVNTKSVRDSIALYPEADEFIVHINSVGGDVYEGYNIGQILKNLGKKTTAQIGAMCASIASFAACCCDVVIMAPQGDFMIHLPTGTLSGTADDLRRGAAQLDRIKSELIDRYMTKVARKGVTRDQLSEMIDKETSMSPLEAAKFGFIDSVQEKMKAVAKFDLTKFNMNDIKNTEEVKGFFSELGKKIDNLAAKFTKVVNSVAVTLADGSTIQSDAADINAIAGSMLTDEAGSPLKAGTYETIDGLALVVDDTGKCVSADPIVADKNSELEKLKQENAALKEQLAKSTQTANEQAKAVEAVAKEVAEFKNTSTELKKIKAEFEKLKNETFGDTAVSTDAPDKTKINTNQIDPMVDAMAKSLGVAYTSSRKF